MCLQEGGSIGGGSCLSLSLSWRIRSWCVSLAFTLMFGFRLSC